MEKQNFFKKHKLAVLLIALVLCFVIALSVVTIVKLNNGGAEIVDLAEHRQTILEEIGEKYDVLLYEEEYHEAVLALVSDAITNISTRKTVEDVDKAYDYWKEKLAEIPSIKGVIDEFNEYKASAVTSLVDYSKLKTYEKAEQTKIDKILAEAEKAINKMETTTAIDEYVVATKALIDDVVAISDKQLQSVIDFNNKKVSAIVEIDGYVFGIAYYEAEEYFIQNIKTRSITEIQNVAYNEVTGISQIQGILDNAKKQIDGVKTKTQLDDAFKEVAVKEAKEYLGTVNYYDEQIKEIATIIADFEKAILPMENQADVTKAKEDTFKKLDDVMIKAEFDVYFAEYKVQAKAKIDGFKSGESLNEAQTSILNYTKNKAKSDVDNATTVKQIDSIVLVAETEITAI